MEYGKIINDSFRIAWKHKSLWLFGLFAGGGGTGFNFDDRLFREYDLGFDLEDFFGSWDIPFDWHLLIPVIVAFAVMGLGFMVMHLISVPALIDGVNKIQRGGEYRLGSSFSVGIDFFWRFLGLSVIGFMIVLSVIMLGIGFGVVAYAVHWAVMVFYILIMIPVFLVFIFGVTSVFELGTRAMVVRDIGVFESLHEGYFLFRHHLGYNAIMFLIYIGFSIGLGIGALMIWAMVGIPIALLVLASGLGIVPAIILAVIMGIPVSLVVGGFCGTALESLYTLYYFDLVEPGGPTQNATPSPAAPLT